LKQKCKGCTENVKATWCAVRTCCLENKYVTCADCTTFSNAADCKKLNNFISKTISLFTGSDRPASIKLIKEKGCDYYCKEMADKKTHCVKKS